MKLNTTIRQSKLFALALAAAAAAALLLAAPSSAQSNKPISRKGLVESVKANGLSTVELVRIINRRGVAFEMTPDAEAELRSVGARPEVIEAARSNYRDPAPATPAVASRPTTNRPANVPSSGSSAPVPPGPPLSKNEIITMLQGGIAPARVEQFVEARGVSFSVTPEVAREITAAGGNRSLVGAITEKATAETASSSSPFGADSGEAANSGAPTYDDYIDRAQTAISAQDWSSAINYAQQAAQLDPQQPTAFTLLGTMLLYASRNVGGAEQAMSAAIQRGGAAAFKVYHDHTGSFSQYCQGSFFVTKTGVSFKADDGLDTFETEDSNIKEAKTNAWVGSEYGAFHIKPVQKINGRDNFNFAPATQQKAEAELILRMIRNF
ncbi:MAG TPA: hypothetical protein VD968_01500 [Pyrinomonadaceae bacterium]|nr:hypothetical protein [Pyrinomonadaceae bacterium]